MHDVREGLAKMQGSRSTVSVAIDPSLGCGREASRLLAEAVMALGGSIAVFRSGFCPAMLAIERAVSEEGGPSLYVRPASADEVLAAYLGFGWTMADRTIEWQEKYGGRLRSDRAVVLWTGQVLSRRHRGVSSPFYAIEEASEAWAFCESAERPEDVCGVQVVRWHCVESFAGELVASEENYKRLRCFFVSPVRSVWVREIWVPAHERLVETVWEGEKTGP
jgi:hypothetical protein